MPNDRVRQFLDTVAVVCRMFDLSIAHEDHQGAFIVEEYDQTNIDWLRAAHFAEDLPDGTADRIGGGNLT